jgi:hypothetical protein
MLILTSNYLRQLLSTKEVYTSDASTMSNMLDFDLPVKKSNLVDVDYCLSFPPIQTNSLIIPSSM